MPALSDTLRPERGAVCWVITGAGHFLEESIKQIESLQPADVFLTRAAVEVLALYALRERLNGASCRVIEETGHSAMPSIYFSGGRYRYLVIAPATANSVAKFSLGIADSMASIFFAQAGKSRVPTVVLPTDLKSEMVTCTSSGREIPIYPRPVDLFHVRRLRRFQDVHICIKPDQIANLIK